jgi:2-hydroxychromene-2-carboxylate isomerase
MRIQFWFDFASPYSYLTAMRIEAAAQAVGVQVDWRAFLLGPLFREQGWRDSPFNLYPAKGRYMWQDIRRSCEELGLPYTKPFVFPRNGLLAARIACRHAKAPWLPAFVRTVYHANFAEDRNISAVGTIGDCLEVVGQDAAGVIASATTSEAKQLLQVRTEEARSLGIFGAPSFIVADELYWGNDRLAAAFHACRVRR